MELEVSQNYNIFNALHGALREKERRRLRFAKCPECGRVTPYKLRSLELTTVRCKRCETSIPIDTQYARAGAFSV